MCIMKQTWLSHLSLLPTSIQQKEIHMHVYEKLMESLGSVLVSRISCLVSALVISPAYMLLISGVLSFQLVDHLQDIA